VIYVMLWVFCGFVCWAIASSKHDSGCVGFLIGFLLGPLGVLLVLASGGKVKQCPHCKERIHKDAVKCPKCQTNLTGTAGVVK